MTKAEVLKVANIAMGADGGCFVCASGQISALIHAFPNKAEGFKAAWKENFGEDWKDE